MTSRTRARPIARETREADDDEDEAEKRARVRARLAPDATWREEPDGKPRPARAPSSPARAEHFFRDVSGAADREGPRVAKLRAIVDRWTREKAAVARGDSVPAPRRDAPPYYDAFRQNAAFEWGDEWEASRANRGTSFPPMRYFSREDPERGGVRRFVASTYDEFWRRYKDLDHEKRHHYEIIRADRPCHLYYDLEYPVGANPEADGARATDALVALTLEDLAAHEGVMGEDGAPLRAEDVVVELLSPSAKKFSRHLVFHLPGVAFANAAHVGHFVRRLMRRAESSRNVDERCDLLFVREGGDDAVDAEVDGDDETTTEATNRSGCSGVSSGSRRDVPFVDMGVYTRNRAFRLYLSSKFGKKTRLLPTRRLWRAPDASRPKTQPDETTFYKSLVCNVDPKVRLVSYEGVGQSGAYVGRVLTGYGDEPAASRRGASAGASVSSSRFSGDMPCPDTAAFVCRDFDGWSPPGCVGASIRSWAAYPDAGTVMLHAQGNRFCENVERAHKSNNVLFVVDFNEGAYHQRCHDPECRGYRGCLRPLPYELAREALALFALARGEGNEGEGGEEEWAPPKIDSGDEDDDALRAAADEATARRWAPPRIDDDDEAFWRDAAALVEDRGARG